MRNALAVSPYIGEEITGSPVKNEPLEEDEPKTIGRLLAGRNEKDKTMGIMGAGFR